MFLFFVMIQFTMREGFFVVTEEGTYVSVNEVVPKKI